MYLEILLSNKNVPKCGHWRQEFKFGFFFWGGGTPVFEGDARRRGAPGSLRQNRPQPSRRREGVVPVVVVGHSDADADAATDADADAVADQAPVAVSFRRRSQEKVSKKNNFFFNFYIQNRLLSLIIESKNRIE